MGRPGITADYKKLKRAMFIQPVYPASAHQKHPLGENNALANLDFISIIIHDANRPDTRPGAIRIFTESIAD